MRRLRSTPCRKLYRSRSEENTLAGCRDNNVGRKKVSLKIELMDDFRFLCHCHFQEPHVS